MLSRSSDARAAGAGHVSGWGGDDPLSSVLLDLRLSGTFFCHSEFDDPWAVEIPERAFASFHFVTAGECWLQPLPPDGSRAAAVALYAGDLVLLPRSPRHVLSSEKRRKGAPPEALPSRRLVSDVPTVRVPGRRSGRWLVVCGGVRIEAPAAGALVNSLPEVVVLRADDAGPIVASALDAMKRESLAARLGSVTLMTRLADVVVIHAIRSWLERADPRSGWLAALRHHHIGRSLTEVHRRPNEGWSVDAMARVARLSRSRFSQLFTRLIGEAPMQYVTHVRMQRARDQLRSEGLTIAELAGRFGYASESAFARAFKRHVGATPGAVRRDAGPRASGT